MSSLFQAFAKSEVDYQFTLVVSTQSTLTIPDDWPDVEVVEVVRHRRFHQLYRLIFEYRTLKKIIRKTRPDAILALGNIAPKTSGVPTTVLLHHLLIADTSLPPAPPAIGRVNLAVNRFLFRRTANRAEAIIVQTAHMKQLVHDNYGISLDRIHVVENNVAAVFSRPSGMRSAKPPTADGPLRLIYPASPHPYKNIDLILQLASKFKSEQAGLATFALTLDATTAAGMSVMKRVRAEELDDIVVNIGILDQKQLSEQYSSSDALFFPSLAESLGNPLLEAAAAGLPVVAADLPYAHDVMADSALFFDPHDVLSAQKSIESLRDPTTWTEYSKRARARYESTPTWKEIGDRFLEIVSSTISEDND